MAEKNTVVTFPPPGEPYRSVALVHNQALTATLEEGKRFDKLPSTYLQEHIEDWSDPERPYILARFGIERPEGLRGDVAGAAILRRPEENDVVVLFDDDLTVRSAFVSPVNGDFETASRGERTRWDNG